MSMINNTTSKNAYEKIRVTDLFVERVPDPHWKERAAAGKKPSAFFNVRGVARLGEEFVSVEFNVGATNADGKFLKWPTAKADRNGVRVVVAPPRSSDHGAKIQVTVKDEIPVLDENGMPVLAEPVTLPEGWSVMSVVKVRVNLDRGLDVTISDVEVVPVLKDGAPVIRTLNGAPRRCMKVVLHDSRIETVQRERIELAPLEDEETVGAGADWRLRKTAAATPAVTSEAGASWEAAVEAAAAEGRRLRG